MSGDRESDEPAPTPPQEPEPDQPEDQPQEELSASPTPEESEPAPAVVDAEFVELTDAPSESETVAEAEEEAPPTVSEPPVPEAHAESSQQEAAPPEEPSVVPEQPELEAEAEPHHEVVEAAEEVEEPEVETEPLSHELESDSYVNETPVHTPFAPIDAEPDDASEVQSHSAWDEAGESPFGEADIPFPGETQRYGTGGRDAQRVLDLDLARIKRSKRFGFAGLVLSVLFIAFVLAPVTWVVTYRFVQAPATILMFNRAAEGQASATQTCRWRISRRTSCVR